MYTFIFIFKIYLFQDAVRQERQVKERLGREKDVLIAEKFNLEQQLAVRDNTLLFEIPIMNKG